MNPQRRGLNRSDLPLGKVISPIKGTLDSITIENVQPELDGGRFPVKGIVGDTFEVWQTFSRMEERK